jgi:hypothetical protein
LHGEGAAASTRGCTGSTTWRGTATWRTATWRTSTWRTATRRTTTSTRRTALATRRSHGLRRSRLSFRTRQPLTRCLTLGDVEQLVVVLVELLDECAFRNGHRSAATTRRGLACWLLRGSRRCRERDCDQGDSERLRCGHRRRELWESCCNWARGRLPRRGL